jgi:hypothetical protein
MSPRHELSRHAATPASHISRHFRQLYFHYFAELMMPTFSHFRRHYFAPAFDS